MSKSPKVVATHGNVSYNSWFRSYGFVYASYHCLGCPLARHILFWTSWIGNLQRSYTITAACHWSSQRISRHSAWRGRKSTRGNKQHWRILPRYYPPKLDKPTEYRRKRLFNSVNMSVAFCQKYWSKQTPKNYYRSTMQHFLLSEKHWLLLCRRYSTRMFSLPTNLLLRSCFAQNRMWRCNSHVYVWDQTREGCCGLYLR